MMRLLFVDDDPKILESIENQLFDKMGEWDMSFANSGESAIKLMDESDFDIVVTDMRMPGIDGPQLLQYTKKSHPGTIRMVLSGHAEIEAAMKAIPLAHQYLGKPCDQQLLVKTLEQALEIHTITRNEGVRRAFGRVMELPCQMHVYNNLTRVLSKDSANFEEVAALIDTDPSLTTKVIYAANTAFFAGSRQATNTLQAVQRLGLVGTKMLVMATEITSLLGDVSDRALIQSMQEHCQQVALVAGILSDADLRTEAVLAAIVHDLGSMIFASFMPGEFAKCASLAGKDLSNICEAEREVFGVTHAEFGGIVLDLWRLPSEVVYAVTTHHDLEGGNFAGHPIALALAMSEIVVGSQNPMALAQIVLGRLPPDLAQGWKTKLGSFWKQEVSS